jgi:hypothetical protein|tara:strand:+ start:222 stop:797 length:576 start_codon:yes stop_codon:yes gene_type:complete
VRVDGYARIFHLVSLNRGQARGPIRSGLRGAVLDARPWAGAQMGAVRFDVTGVEQEELDQREFCYDRHEGVAWRDFQQPARRGRALVYSVSSAATLQARFPQLYRERIFGFGVDGLLSDRIRPLDDYLRLCIEGAFSWGRAFGHHFLANTWLGDGRCLSCWGPAIEVTRALGEQITTVPYANLQISPRTRQ